MQYNKNLNSVLKKSLTLDIKEISTSFGPALKYSTLSNYTLECLRSLATIREPMSFLHEYSSILTFVLAALINPKPIASNILPPSSGFSDNATSVTKNFSPIYKTHFLCFKLLHIFRRPFTHFELGFW